MIKHTVNGMPVNDQTLAVDVIKEIQIQLRSIVENAEKELGCF